MDEPIYTQLAWGLAPLFTALCILYGWAQLDKEEA